MIPAALHAFNPGPLTGDGNWTWLIHGRVPTLVDAGVGDPRHLQALEAALGSVPLAQVLVTHGHSDHASGAPALASRWPDAAFLKMPWPERDARLPAGSASRDPAYVRRAGSAEGGPAGTSWTALADGDVVQAGDTSLEVVHTPGHAPDHLCFWHEATRAVFAGDLVIKGSTVFIPAVHGDMAAYLSSLERILALDPARILPAHGPAIDDPAPLLRRYISHRLEREEQVLDALRRGITDVGEIVRGIYRGLPEALVPRAGESVTAHLLKLEREGRARSSDGAWNIIDP